jgi:DNA repair exonuclease SbcCD nuclease subunit
MIYGLMADLHAHNFSQFATVNPDGVNSRLAAMLNEIDRCCEATSAAGGFRVVIAGDVFHTRGSVAPSVFNPVKDKLEHWANIGIEFHIIPGNHDLESKDSRALTSAVQMLHDGRKIWAQPFHRCVNSHAGDRCILLVPYQPTQAALLELLGKLSKGLDDLSQTDVIIHAGIDGVLPGMPDHGLTAAKLQAFGFRRVFAGDYHAHKDLGGGIYSIGAPCHQTWGDVGSQAGWMVVTPESATFHASDAPRFIEIAGTEDPDELPFIVEGHFVRLRLGEATAAEVETWRESLIEMGAKGVTIQSQAKGHAAVRGATVTGFKTLAEAVRLFGEGLGHSAEVLTLCAETLREAEA